MRIERIGRGHVRVGWRKYTSTAAATRARNKWPARTVRERSTSEAERIQVTCAVTVVEAGRTELIGVRLAVVGTWLRVDRLRCEGRGIERIWHERERYVGRRMYAQWIAVRII